MFLYFIFLPFPFLLMSLTAFHLFFLHIQISSFEVPVPSGMPQFSVELSFIFFLAGVFNISCPLVVLSIASMFSEVHF